MQGFFCIICIYNILYISCFSCVSCAIFAPVLPAPCPVLAVCALLPYISPFFVFPSVLGHFCRPLAPLACFTLSPDLSAGDHAAPFPGFRVFFFVVRQGKHGTRSPGVPRPPLVGLSLLPDLCAPCPLFSPFGSWTQTRPPPCPSLSVCSRSPLCCRWKLSGAFQLAALCRDPAAVCVRPSAPVPGIYPGQTKKAARRGCLSHGHIMDALAV